MELRGHRRANKPLCGLFSRHYYNRKRKENLGLDKPKIYGIITPALECETQKRPREK